MPAIPEEFWKEEECIGNSNDAQRLLTAEIDRLENENKQLRESLKQVSTELDIYRGKVIRLENSNAQLVRQYGRR